MKVGLCAHVTRALAGMKHPVPWLLAISIQHSQHLGTCARAGRGHLGQGIYGVCHLWDPRLTITSHGSTGVPSLLIKQA